MTVGSCGDMNVLPEDCIANALSLTSPKDACRLSSVATIFRSASQSDTLWDRFLPSDYRDLISRAADGPGSSIFKFRSKKDLYLHLCDHPILIDGGRKSFSLEKCSGKKCYMISARDLHIVWSDDLRYWKWITLPESRFPEVAELLDVCWLEIRGKICTKMLSPGTCYMAYLVFTCKSGAYGFDDHPVETFVQLSGHAGQKYSAFLDPYGPRRPNRPIFPRTLGLFYRSLPRLARQHAGAGAAAETDAKCPKGRSDGWMEIELGEYFVEGGEDAELELGVMEVAHGHWKGGFIFQGIELRPKAVNS